MVKEKSLNNLSLDLYDINNYDRTSYRNIIIFMLIIAIIKY